MQYAKTKRLARFVWSNSILLITALTILVGLGLYINNAARIFQTASIPEAQSVFTQISQAELEERYGLRVNLVAATAAGGLVDVRLKMVDGEKARSLLADPKNYPALWIAEGDVTLAIPQENRAEQIQFEDDGNLFLMFPNARGIIKPGTTVSVRFGEIQLEPIPAK